MVPAFTHLKNCQKGTIGTAGGSMSCATLGDVLADGLERRRVAGCGG